QRQSHCFLFSQSPDSLAISRLKYLQSCQDGLKIARYDLAHRGPGEIFSFLQHGFPSLKLADISDLKLIQLSQKVLASLQNLDPSFDLNRLISRQSEARLPASN
ncbi:MAG TPA: hypothetical protein PLE07_03110, partial [Candidatus Paceibacterota bacterium]|nr:hypothetical protein [Candidatus Paceibacterota bacterium]